MQELKRVEIYTDGACSGNPGPGGYGAVLLYGGNKKELSGAEAETTNNRMEIFAAIAGLRALKQRCTVSLYSDSAYLVNAIEQGWLGNWKRNGWTGSNNKPVKNRDLWEELDSLMSYHEVTFIKVKGHADNELNNRCDALARAAIEELRKSSD